MKTNELKYQTDRLRMKVIQRVLLAVFGCIVASVVTLLMPGLYFFTARVETSAGGPGQVPPDPSFPFAAVLPPVVIMLLVIAGLGYLLYDGIRLYMEYRRSKQMDEEMFP